MSREKFLIGNWKMNLLGDESCQLVAELVKLFAKTKEKTSIYIAPSSCYLQNLSSNLKTSNIKLAAQNVAHLNGFGAFTGEISDVMLKSFNVEMVLVGHSERRLLLNESDELINQKIQACVQADLIPVLCVGETLAHKEARVANKIIEAQLTTALAEVAPNNLVIAYEPVWAIGTGKVAKTEEIESMHLFIRNTLQKIYADKKVNKIAILYGGSVNTDNSKEIFALANVDGALVGGASLKADSFYQIYQNL